MEPNAKYIVYLNIFLLSIHLTCTIELTSTSSITPGGLILGSSTVSSNSLDATKENVITTPPAIENATQVESATDKSSITINIDSTVSNDNTFDSISAITEGSQDVIQPDTLEKLLRGEEAEEMEDLQHGGEFQHIPKTINEDDEVILPQPIDNDKGAPRWETEWIEEEFDDKEDEDVPPFVEVMTAQSNAQHAFEGHLMGIIIASFLITFLVTGYVALVGWRRFIHKRYGSRQILVNEEDMIDPNDMKHFSL